MSDVSARIADSRAALDTFLATADENADVWTTPRAPGKWSPSQLSEHIARALESSANAMRGAPSNFPSLPFFLRPLARGLLFNRVITKRGFPKAKTNKAMDPERGPDTAEAARERLNKAFEGFEAACREAEERGSTVDTKTFGTVGLADFIDFTGVHIVHHGRQFPSAGA